MKKNQTADRGVAQRMCQRPATPPRLMPYVDELPMRY